MSGDVIQFPGKKPEESESVVRQVSIFHITEDGIVDLAEGVTLTDAVTEFWEAVGDVVREAWADSPLAREKARTRLLSAYLDKECPGWREELSWKV